MNRLVGCALVVCACDADPGATRPVGFFVTSVGNERGGDFGGLEGADARCRSLAADAGLTLRTWRAFLSASGPVHARDRIGAGPWTNAVGDVVAEDVEQLIADGIPSVLMLDERGEPAGKGPPPGPAHDILTGSDQAGRLEDGATCNDWTSSDPGVRVAVGHHDWSALPDDEWTQHWIRVHGAPCDPEGMARQLGTARIYCFATD